MFGTVVKFLEDLASGEAMNFERDDRNLAIAALLYHMVTIDGVVKPSEIQRFRQILSDRFGLRASRLDGLIDKARLEDREFSGLFPLTSIINHECSDAQKAGIVDQMMQLAVADGELKEAEAHLLRSVSQLLKIPLPDRLQAAE